MAYLRTESFQEIQEIQKHLISLKWERMRRSTKIINFPKHISPSYHSQQQKIKKTSDDSENWASLSQIGRRCLPLSYTIWNFTNLSKLINSNDKESISYTIGNFTNISKLINSNDKESTSYTIRNFTNLSKLINRNVTDEPVISNNSFESI